MEKTQEQLNQEKMEQERVSQIKALLDNFEKAPTVAQVDQWKAIHGEVLMSALSETELYLFRPVRRFEYRQIQQEMTKLQESGQQVDESSYQEMLCQLVVLWKSEDTEWSKTKAGTLTTLTEQVHQHSNFYSAQTASMLVIKL